MGYHKDSLDKECFIQDMKEALPLLLEAFDALLPGAKYIAVDIGLLNEAAMKARPLVEKIKNG